MLEICKRHTGTHSGRIRLGICVSMIFIAAMIVGLLVLAKPYAVYASGEKIAEPWAVVIDGKEVAIVESKEAGDSVLTGLKAAYCEGVVKQQEAKIDKEVIVGKYKFKDTNDHPVVMKADEAVEHIKKLNATAPKPVISIGTTKTENSTKAIPYETVEVDSETLYKGEKKVKTEGVAGSRDVVEEVKYVNGKEVDRKEISSKTTKEAVKKEILVGVKERPVAPAVSSSPSRSYSTRSYSSPAPAPSPNGSSLTAYATQFVGNPYVYGGTSLTNGADCSGFTQAIYRQFGVNLPRTSYAQGARGVQISASEARAGDLVYYGWHVGIYLGNGQMVHASNPSQGIIIGPVNWGAHTYRRVM